MSTTRHIRPLIATLALLGSANIVACGDSIGQGQEFIKDTWRNPTYHGDLEFGGESPGEFTEEERFHAWTFELTGEASVVLEARLSTQNLDSVMYLYKKQENGNWGSYIKKNDDGADLGLGSRIKKSLGAGEYQIKVRATKDIMTGNFVVAGTCSGEGCPAEDAFCGPASDDMPERTGYSQSCAEKMHAILTTPVGHSGPQCLEDNLEERAVAWYKSYWDEVWSWEEISYGEEPSVSLTHHSDAGTIVGVDLGGDEDAMTYVFDAEGNLMFYYQHNQSPDWAWFCEGDVEENQDPGDDCANEVAWNSEYRLEDTTEADGTIAADATGDLPPHVGAAIAEYVAEQSLASDASVTYSYLAWEDGYDQGADVQLSADGAESLGYTVTGTPDYGMTLTFRTDANGTSFVCKNL